MTAYVNIAVAKRENVLTVPNAALRFKLPDDLKPVAEAAPAGGARPGGEGASPRKGRRGDGQSGTVHVLVGDEIRPVPVQLGITDNRNTEVVGGELKAGDRVIIGENGPGAKKPSSVGMRMF
jgi:HlyD family secretion protein